MTSDDGVIDELAGALRADGLDVRTDRQADEIHVGVALRGVDARPVTVQLRRDDLDEFLRDLHQANAPEADRHSRAVGYLGTLLIESTTAVHDGESNLTTAVRLQRGPRGRLGLVEDRAEGRPPEAPDGDGPFGWVAERPDGRGGGRKSQRGPLGDEQP